jgi:hypothetical protein
MASICLVITAIEVKIAHDHDHDHAHVHARVRGRGRVHVDHYFDAHDLIYYDYENVYYVQINFNVYY